MLDLLHFSEQYTAEWIQQIIIQVLEENKITEKLLEITMDNVTSMVATDRELKEKLENAKYIH